MYLKYKLQMLQSINVKPALKMAILSLFIVLSIGITSARAEFSLTPQNEKTQAVGNPDVLPVDEAFFFNYKEGQHFLSLMINIKPGYYLYKNKVMVNLQADAATGTTGKNIPISLPSGVSKQDAYLGDYEALAGDIHIEIPLPIDGKADNTTAPVNLQISYQGCSEKGFCYPKVEKTISISQNHPSPSAQVTAAEPKTSSSPAYSIYANRSGIIILGLFFLSGILLAFTPCVLPMIPILSGIILGQKHKLDTARAFKISLTYTLGMAFAYALVGFLAAGLGQHLQTQMQRPEVIISAALLFLVLGLIEFKVFHYALPLTSSLNTKIQALSNKIPRGTYKGAFLMGILATLVASPCISVPMVGAIAYLADTGDVLLGGGSLFLLGIGMGAPLILASTLGVNYLPHKGIWMERINQFLGFIFIGLSLWLFDRVYPGPHIYILAAILCVITSVEFYKGKWFAKLMALIIVLAGISFAIKVVNPNIMVNLKNNHQVASIETLDSMLQKFKGHKIILDYSANWCSSCLQIEKEILQHPDAQASLKDWILIKVDVSEVNDTTKALYDRFGLMAPPVLIFLDKEGHEYPQSRKVGTLNLGEFIEHLKKWP